MAQITQYEAVPAELKALPNWVAWRFFLSEEGKKPRKIPINPKTGQPAESNNPDTWGSFDEAVSCGGEGIGFMFGHSPYFGVDLDNITDSMFNGYKEGEDNALTEFVDTLNSYTEYSPSGTGIHIICRGTLPPRGRRSGDIEMYETGRFFTVTGQPFGVVNEITDCTEPIKYLHEKYIGGGQAPSETKPILGDAVLSTVRDVVERAEKAANGSLFARLYKGDTSGYSSSSEADMALCNLLAFWCGRDAALMDSVFRSSGLFREKWDRKQNGTTYGAITLRKAIDDCTTVYTPRKEENDGYSVSIGTAKKVFYSFDDLGNTQRMNDLYGDFLRYSYVDKAWMYYDRRKWCSDVRGEIFRAAEAAIKRIDDEAKDYDPETEEGKAFMKHRKSSRSNKSMKAMIEQMQHKVPITPAETDRDTMLFNTMQGVINLEQGGMEPHDFKLYMTKLSPVEYSSEADCPMWKQFLRDIFAEDEDLIRYVQKAVGYSMTGSTAEQCVFFLYGTGSNGKSTFLTVIRQLMGDYATNIQPETIMVKPASGNAANSDIARLKSARFVTTVEPNEGMRLNEGLIKQLSGEDPVTARKQYGNEFEFMPEFKLWMATNHKPIIRGTDTGIWRRVHMIPFEVQIPDERKDRHLGGKLRRELPGILNWAIEGCLLYQREGLKMPQAVAEAVAEYRHEMDVVSLFIEECCDNGGQVGASVLYSAYKQWAFDSEQHIHTSTKFGREISKRYAKVKGMYGAAYQGVQLKNYVKIGK